MNKTIIPILVLLVLVSSAFAVNRGVTGQTITYSAVADFSCGGGGCSKAYWAVQDTISGIGCSLNTVNPTSCGADCEYSVLGGTIRLVVFPPSDAAYTLPDTKQITLDGSGSGCTLSGTYAEAPGVSATEQAITVGNSVIDLTTCTSMDNVLTSIGQWKGSSLSMDNLLTIIGQWKTEPC